MKSRAGQKARSSKFTDKMIIDLLEEHIKLRVKDSERFGELQRKTVKRDMRQIIGMMEDSLQEDAKIFTLMLAMIKRQKNRLKNYHRKK